MWILPFAREVTSIKISMVGDGEIVSFFSSRVTIFSIRLSVLATDINCASSVHAAVVCPSLRFIANQILEDTFESDMTELKLVCKFFLTRLMSI